MFWGEPDADLEHWLGKYFVSWGPSAAHVVIRMGDGLAMMFGAPQAFAKDERGFCPLLPYASYAWVKDEAGRG